MKQTTNYQLILLAVAVAIFAFGAGAQARPWWWAQFSAGSGSTVANTGYARWHAFFVKNIPSTDTAFVVSYSWSTTGGVATIDGINGASDGGLNSHSAAGAPVDYLIGDGTTSNDNGWTNASGLVDVDVTLRRDASTTEIMHHKTVFGRSRGWIMGSANMTSGGWNSQYNNSILFHDTVGMSSFFDKVEWQYEKMANGTFHDGTAFGTINYFSRYGDTVELRFTPADNDGGSAPGAGSVISRYRQLVSQISQSVFFVSDAWSASVGTTELSDDIINKAGITWGGVVGDGGDVDATIRSNLEGDANGTLRNHGGGFNRIHHKFIVFDQEVVGTGSPNMTAAAMRDASPSNDEAHVIVHDFRIGRRYMREWRRVMANSGSDPSSDGFDVTAPNGATGLGVTPTSSSFNLTWTASASADVSRYYLFIHTAAMTQNDIGDGIDDDGDTYVDEDPLNDYDGFPSGSTTANDVPNDDDADGTSDEDLWMAPEVQVKGRASNSGTISSINVGDSLLAATNYYFAIVSVDTQGNEGTIATAGPFQLAAAAVDTKAKAVFNSNLADTTVPRGNTNVIASTVWIRGDTGAAGDTLVLFAVKNLGTADTQDVVVKLWRDENNDSALSVTADSLVATLSYSTTSGRWQSAVANDSRARLPSTGKSFLVTIDIYDTATIGDTFQVRIDSSTIDVTTFDSGPTTTTSNTGKITFLSANSVSLALRGTPATGTVAKGTNDSIVMTARLSVNFANDTITVFRVRNDGTMTSSDVGSLDLYQDGDGDSVLDAAPIDTLIANLPYISGSDWGAGGINYKFTGTTINLLAVLDVSAGASGLRTFQGRVVASTLDCAVADTGPNADVLSLTVVTIASDTSPDTAIVINEAFALTTGTGVDPDHDNDAVTGAAEEQYVELYNNSDGNVSLAGWDIGDQTAGDATFNSGLVLGPRQFLIIYRGTDAAGKNVYVYDTTGANRILSDTVSGTFPAITSPDTVNLRNASAVQIDSMTLTTSTAFRPWMRVYDGAPTIEEHGMRPGSNTDPTGTFNQRSPNATFSIVPSKTSVNEGESFTLTITMLDADTVAIPSFVQTASLSSNTGTPSSTTTGAFTAGVRSESFSVSNVVATCSAILTVRYNSTTFGTTTITVNNLATVTCTVALQARANHSQCTGVLTKAGYTDTQVSNAAGTIVFSSVPPGSYSLSTKEYHHLQVVNSSVVVGGSDVVVNQGTHLAGDANHDNRINIFDAGITRFLRTFGSGTKADIDGDGDVDSADLQWIRSNFGRTGQ